MPDTDPVARSANGMLCPVCKIDLLLSERQGIEIDYCPQCRGVWLDRGELDKIIERNASYEAGSAAPSAGPGYAPPAPPQAQTSPWGYDNGHGGGRHGRSHGEDRHGGGHRRGGFLGGLFRH